MRFHFVSLFFLSLHPFISPRMVWILQLNGLMVDIRQLPIEVQQMAFEKGLIPFVPALQTENTQ